MAHGSIVGTGRMTLQVSTSEAKITDKQRQGENQIMQSLQDILLKCHPVDNLMAPTAVFVIHHASRF
jgi:hypothetical protein